MHYLFFCFLLPKLPLRSFHFEVHRLLGSQNFSDSSLDFHWLFSCWWVRETLMPTSAPSPTLPVLDGLHEAEFEALESPLRDRWAWNKNERFPAEYFIGSSGAAEALCSPQLQSAGCLSMFWTNCCVLEFRVRTGSCKSISILRQCFLQM